MNEILPILENIIKYGIQPNIIKGDKEAFLQKNLIPIYHLYFNAEFQFDDKNYNDFTIAKLPNIRQNVESNFRGFGYYKTVINIYDINNLDDVAIGDAIDDLADIIRDLLEIKWRIQNNSVADGLWFFKVIFKAHTEQHILDLLNYIKQKEE